MADLQKIWIVELSDYIDSRACSGDWSSFDVLSWGLAELGWTEPQDWSDENIWIEDITDEHVMAVTSSGDNLIRALLVKVVE